MNLSMSYERTPSRCIRSDDLASLIILPHLTQPRKPTELGSLHRKSSTYAAALLFDDARQIMLNIRSSHLLRVYPPLCPFSGAGVSSFEALRPKWKVSLEL